MYTFLDHFDNEYGSIATIEVTNAVNGEKSIKGEIYSNDNVLHNIDKGWRLRFQDEYFVITYAKPKDVGNKVQVSFDAVHQFFWDFSKLPANEQLADGSHTFQAYLGFIFKDTGYRYSLEQNAKAFEKQSFGYKSKLALFNDVVSTAGVEFQVNGKVVRILEKTGTDLSTVVRKNFNMNDLTIEKNIDGFITYQKGFGAWNDKDDHSKGRLEVEYESPLAKEFGRLGGEPVVDERYTDSQSLLSVLRSNVENSYTISVQIDMEDLTRAGYRYDQPVAGDYIMAINETLGFQEKIRIVSYTSQYDAKGTLISHKVTCNDIGSVKKQSSSYARLSKSVNESNQQIQDALIKANNALVTADGKNTAYFGTEFPRDVPKGTLTRGDIFYRTVGDRTLMYFWNGSDWEDNPVLNDVEEFKRDINQQFDEFNESYETEQAKQDQAVKEVLDKASAAENLAGQAKSISDQAKADAIAEANRLVASAKQSLDGQFAQQAQQLLTQASAQEQLTRRTSAIEQLANSAKTTLTELSKTVNDQTGQIVNVNKRTKVVEDGIAGLTARYDNLIVGGVNLAVVAEPSGYYNNNGVFTKSDSYRATELIAVEDAQYLLQSWFPAGSKSNWVGLVYFDANQRYIANTYQSIPGIGEYDKRIITPTNAKYVAISYKNGGKVQLEKGVIGSDYRLPDATIQKQLAEYHQSASENYAKLSETVQTAGNKIIETETLVKQTAKGLESRLTATQVNSLIDGKGFATTQTVQNIAKETAGSFERQIIETKGLIPTSIGGRNLWIKKDSYGYSAIEQLPQNHITGQTECYRLENGTSLTFNIEPEFSSRLYGKVTFSAWVKYENVVQGANAWNVFNCFKHIMYRKNSKTGATSTADYTALKSFTGTSDWQKITVTYDYGQNTNYDQLKTQLRFYVEHATSGTAWVTGIKVEKGSIATDYSLAIEDAALDTQKFHEIQDTVNSHTRTISEQGKSISQVIQTAQGLVTRVNNLKSGSRNYLLNSKLTTTDMTGISDTGLLDVTINISADFWKHDDVYKNQKIRLSLYYQSSVAYSTSRTFPVHFRKSPWYQIGTITYPAGATQLMKYEFVFDTMPSGFDASQIFIRFDRALDRGRVHTIERAQLEVSDMFSDWSLAPEDSDTAVQAVSTQVSQLAGSWAVKNLTSNGAVLNQINLLANGTNRIDGRLTHITGRTLIDNAVIKDANIASLSASKMTTGTLDAGKVNVINLNASNITSGSLTADRISGGVLQSLNGNTKFNLQNGNLSIDNRSMINLKGAASAIFREMKYNNSFLMFNDLESASSGYSTVVLGASTDKNFETQSSGFTGLYISPRDRRLIVTANSIYFQTIHNGGAGVLIEKQGLGTNIRGITYNPLTIGTSDKPIEQIFVDKLNNLKMGRDGIYGSAGGLVIGDETLLYSNDGNVELSGNDINFVYKVNGTRYQLTLKDILRQIGYKV